MKSEARKKREAEEKKIRLENIKRLKQERIETKLSPAEAAALLGIKEATLGNWRSRAVGPAYVKTGGRVFYFKKDLEAFERRIER